MSEKFCVIVHGDTFDKIQTAVGLVSTAVSMGREAHVYLTFGALWHFVNETIEDAPIEIGPPEVKKMYQRAVDRGTIPEPGEMLEALRERGGVRIYGCSTSVKVLQLSPQQLGQVDAVMGHASFMSIAEGGQLVVI